MSNLEKISAYLENEMSAEERQNFEQSVASNPELERELNLQKDIIEGIKEARKNELKAIMDNVPIGGTIGLGGSITFGKLATGIAVVGLFSLGAYYLINDTESTDLFPPKVIESIELADAEENNASTASDDAQPVSDEVKQPATNSTKTKEPTKTEKSSTSKTNNVTALPEINKPSAAPLFETSESDSLEAPTNEIVETIEGNITSLDVEIDNSKKKYAFHYQFNRGKLFLYGDFDKELYEILEFKTNSDKTLFLYYENKFYPLNKKQVKITELKPVKEKSLIEKLQKVVEIE